MKELGTAVTSAKALHKGDQRGQTPQLQGCLHRGSPTALHGEQLPLSSVCCPLQLAGGGEGGGHLNPLQLCMALALLLPLPFNEQFH